MPIQRQEDIVEFQIPVYNPLGMEIFQGEEYFASVVFSLSECELFLLDVKHEIAAGYVFHDEVDAGFGLETRVKVE